MQMGRAEFAGFTTVSAAILFRFVGAGLFPGGGAQGLHFSILFLVDTRGFGDGFVFPARGLIPDLVFGNAFHEGNLARAAFPASAVKR